MYFDIERIDNIEKDLDNLNKENHKYIILLNEQKRETERIIKEMEKQKEELIKKMEKQKKEEMEKEKQQKEEMEKQKEELIKEMEKQLDEQKKELNEIIDNLKTNYDRLKGRFIFKGFVDYIMLVFNIQIDLKYEDKIKLLIENSQKNEIDFSDIYFIVKSMKNLGNDKTRQLQKLVTVKTRQKISE